MRLRFGTGITLGEVPADSLEDGGCAFERVARLGSASDVAVPDLAGHVDGLAFGIFGQKNTVDPDSHGVVAGVFIRELWFKVSPQNSIEGEGREEEGGAYSRVLLAAERIIGNELVKTRGHMEQDGQQLHIDAVLPAVDFAANGVTGGVRGDGKKIRAAEVDFADVRGRHDDSVVHSSATFCEQRNGVEVARKGCGFDDDVAGHEGGGEVEAGEGFFDGVKFEGVGGEGEEGEEPQ